MSRMYPRDIIQRELEEIELGLLEGTISGVVDVCVALGEKAAYQRLLYVMVEGRDPSLWTWRSQKNREEATIEHNRRITR